MPPDTSSLRFAICGAAPATAELLDQFETRFGIPLVEGYGLTEGTCASTINPLDGHAQAGHRRHRRCRASRSRIVDADGDAVADGRAPVRS